MCRYPGIMGGGDFMCRYPALVHTVHSTRFKVKENIKGWRKNENLSV